MDDHDIEDHIDQDLDLDPSLRDALGDGLDSSISIAEMQSGGGKGKGKRGTDSSGYPKDIFVVPIVRRPFFPGMAAPVVVEPGVYYEVLKSVAKSEHKCMGLFLTKDEDTNIYKAGFSDLHDIGILARILRIIPMEQGGAQVVLNMERRIKIVKQTKSGKFLKAKISIHEDPAETRSKGLKAYSISIITTIKELLKLNPLFKEELQIFLGHSDFTEPGKLADFAVALTTASREELQNVLEAFDLQKRIDMALVLLKKELDLSRLQNSINMKIEQTISKTQREFFLREQLKTIKKELGLEKDDKACDLEKFEGRLKKRVVPEEVMEVIRDEMDKLSVLEVQSAEYAVCRNYLDWLTIIPWGILSKENDRIDHAEKVLAEDHYGLEDTKERILEFISVGKLSGGVKGNILCLVGPPGVGKTSIGKSIARALGRQFYRFSVGGMRDEAEIKGHRRTYVGSMPGKLVQALKQVEVMNPVIMLDEVDKIGNSYHGDPASALLEVLDPEQNHDFLDHYLDVRTDLSHVLFILTANILDTIPDALKDRMEILRLSGYVLEEKVEIARRYLLPKNRKKMGLKATDVVFEKDALIQIIHQYAREAGVRSLESQIKKILRKVALQIVRAEELPEEQLKEQPEEQEDEGKKASKKASKVIASAKSSEKGKKGPKREAIRIEPKNLEKFLGKPLFTSDRFFDQTPIGVCMGLAWTSLGGATLYIEAVSTPSEKMEMKLTGQAGDVMKESAQIAWTYAQKFCSELERPIPFFEKSMVHLHIPEGATPKDGPSAGITMVTALLSLLMKEPVKRDVSMTGELTLTGKVLPIGGVKEKIIAARRSGVKTVILPKENERDYVELAAHIKKGIKVVFVEEYVQVFGQVFAQPLSESSGR